MHKQSKYVNQWLPMKDKIVLFYDENAPRNQ